MLFFRDYPLKLFHCEMFHNVPLHRLSWIMPDFDFSHFSSLHYLICCLHKLSLIDFLYVFRHWIQNGMSSLCFGLVFLTLSFFEIVCQYCCHFLTYTIFFPNRVLVWILATFLFFSFLIFFNYNFPSQLWFDFCLFYFPILWDTGAWFQ